VLRSFALLLHLQCIQQHFGMSTFGKRITAARKDKGLSQGDLAKQIGTMGVVLGRYERDEVKPSIEVAAKLSDALGVSLDYLVGHSEVLLDKELIKRITEIQQLSEADRNGIFFALDGLLRDAKARKAYA